MMNKNQIKGITFDNRNYWESLPYTELEETEGKFISAVTIPATPSCPHANGWHNSIPGRFWGKRRVFVCTDCGDILEPENKKERV